MNFQNRSLVVLVTIMFFSLPISSSYSKDPLTSAEIKSLMSGSKVKHKKGLAWYNDDGSYVYTLSGTGDYSKTRTFKWWITDDNEFCRQRHDRDECGKVFKLKGNKYRFMREGGKYVGWVEKQ